jgi:hypothetical protein
MTPLEDFSGTDIQFQKGEGFQINIPKTGAFL